MRLLPLLIGLVLLSAGLSLYYGISSAHEVQSTQSRQFTSPEQMAVPGTSIELKPLNISSVTTEEQTNPRFVVNVTILSSSDSRLSQLVFRIADRSKESCLVDGAGCVYENRVSNSTVEVPFTAPASYWLIFDNSASDQPKLVSYTVAIRHDLTQTTISRDGIANSLGLGVTIVGALGVVYGVARKTVIPWD